MRLQTRRRRYALRGALAGTLRGMETDGTGQPRTDAATFAAHLAEGSDDPAGRAEHLRRCRPCAEVTRELRADPALGPDLELRLLRAFREWRDT